MLPSTSLCLTKGDGLPGDDGHLSSFTDIYHIDVMATIKPITFLLPILYGVHVDDRNICIPHDVIVGREDCLVEKSKNVRKQNMLLRRIFVEELAISKSFRAGCKRFVPGSFVAYPERYVNNPLVIDSNFIESNKQVLLHV